MGAAAVFYDGVFYCDGSCSAASLCALSLKAIFKIFGRPTDRGVEFL